MKYISVLFSLNGLECKWDIFKWDGIAGAGILVLTFLIESWAYFVWDSM